MITPADAPPTAPGAAASGVEPVTPAQLIWQVRDARMRRERADRDILALGLAWATSHEVVGPMAAEQVGPAGDGTGDFPDSPLATHAPDAGARTGFDQVLAEEIVASEARRQWRGLPLLAWDAAAPFAAALGLSTRGGATVLRHASTLFHRLPKTQARWQTGHADTRTARIVADAIAGQPDDVCVWVDHQVAARLDRHRVVGSVVLERLITEALTELHAEELELQREEELTARYANIVGDPNGPHGRTGPDATGLVEFVIRGDWPDIKTFHDTITALAEAIRRSDRPDAGEPLDVRRSIAVGVIADPAAALALLNPDPDDGASAQTPAHRQKILLTLHLATDAVRGVGSTPVGVDADNRPWLTTMVRGWAARDDINLTVRPLVHCGGCADCQTVCDTHADPDARYHYRPTDLDKELTALLHPRCVFPFCVMPARRTDCDHIIAFDPDDPGVTPTCPRCNLAPLCRHHHRLKTHAGWTYQQLEPGTHTWAEPHGQHFLTSRSGTTDTTADQQVRAGPPRQSASAVV